MLADIDEDDDEVLGGLGRWNLVHVDVEDLAIAAPIAAKVKDDTLVSARACLRAAAMSALGSKRSQVGCFLTKERWTER